MLNKIWLPTLALVVGCSSPEPTGINDITVNQEAQELMMRILLL